jgi:hypothetical protein
MNKYLPQTNNQYMTKKLVKGDNICSEGLNIIPPGSILSYWDNIWLYEIIFIHHRYLLQITYYPPHRKFHIKFNPTVIRTRYLLLTNNTPYHFSPSIYRVGSINCPLSKVVSFQNHSTLFNKILFLV